MAVLQPFIRDRKLKDGVSNATVNRALEVVRRIVNVAHQERRWLRGVPMIRMLKEPRRRVRFLRREEADRLIKVLPTHMKPIVEFALATGCRAGARSWGSNGAAWISIGGSPGSITARRSRATGAVSRSMRMPWRRSNPRGDRTRAGVSPSVASIFTKARLPGTRRSSAPGSRTSASTT